MLTYETGHYGSEADLDDGYDSSETEVEEAEQLLLPRDSSEEYEGEEGSQRRRPVLPRVGNELS